MRITWSSLINLNDVVLQGWKEVDLTFIEYQICYIFFLPLPIVATSMHYLCLRSKGKLWTFLFWQCNRKRHFGALLKVCWFRKGMRRGLLQGIVNVRVGKTLYDTMTFTFSALHSIATYTIYFRVHRMMIKHKPFIFRSNIYPGTCQWQWIHTSLTSWPSISCLFWTQYALQESSHSRSFQKDPCTFIITHSYVLYSCSDTLWTSLRPVIGSQLRGSSGLRFFPDNNCQNSSNIQ